MRPNNCEIGVQRWQTARLPFPPKKKTAKQMGLTKAQRYAEDA